MKLCFLSTGEQPPIGRIDIARCDYSAMVTSGYRRGAVPYPEGMSVTGPGDPLPTSRVLSHLVVMGAVSVVMGVIAAGLAIPLAGVLGIGARDMSNSLDNLPAELQTEALPQKTRILDGDGRLIASLYDENRVNVQLKDVSRTMVKAIVSIEDYRFYKHGALDLKGTLRALITNQASDGVVQGGSSITQQMVEADPPAAGRHARGTEGRHRRHLRAQAARAALRDRVRGEVLQGLDPGAVSQHRLLRRRRLRCAVCRPALLRQERLEAGPPRVRHAGRPGEEPHRLRPDELSRPGTSIVATW